MCVTKNTCHNIGYELRIQCLTTEQCESRWYYQINENTRTCTPISTCEEGKYDNDGSCISREECTLQKNAIIDGGACTSRFWWLNLDSRNFVDLNLEAQIYTEEVNEKSDASILCRAKDGSLIEGVQLIDGKFCQCPRSALYFDPKD